MKIRELFEGTTEKSIKNSDLFFSGLEVRPPEGPREKWEGELVLSELALTSLEGCPKKITKYFSCELNNLTSLEFGPEEVGGDFYCSENQLKSLEFSPRKIDGFFNCTNNKNLTSLKGMTQEGVETLNAEGCDLTSLEGSPQKIDGAFYCSYNKRLKSLKGMTQEGVKRLHCAGCSLSSFEGVARNISGDVFAVKNPMTNLKGVHKHFDTIGGKMLLSDSIESNILGLLKIKNLKRVSFFKNSVDLGEKSVAKKEISDIINKYLPNPTLAEIIDCQNELVEAGFEDYAEL
jgi:hypothetical protein